MEGPYFIVIEGLDGSGKTTQIGHLRDYFQSRGEACYITAEPTELPTGRFIRKVLRGEEVVDPRTLAALFAADRIEHLFHAEHGILAKLAAGYHVISSRYYFSSLAYQRERVDPAWVASLNRLAKVTLPADLTIFLDLDPDVSMRRISARAEGTELFETVDKLRQVRKDFKQAFTDFGQGENISVVDASRPPNEVAEAIGALVKGL
ncbi:Thymidylate kinase [Neolewinella maritima]|uniref:Thymidylate kinase n=1 Tax=Neolewinella maritima TaxID=1383882 RepID=A0ABM9B0N5_9BACT|nr:dTMP kinase [Neolewinella maritima]CAH1000348.1 Thymidylate kinase [Neolewinella maritima]